MKAKWVLILFTGKQIIAAATWGQNTHCNEGSDLHKKWNRLIPSNDNYTEYVFVNQEKSWYFICKIYL